ncbi:hypothetical protein R3X27_14335 [Tropicimonas sp. TH_r6]|uniref:hypothetical protein n=1 Tax=Tropicimonas sp. TH_r6 TaxID=3082085 RepID=UPI00295341BD|nr:hypothetical protein [Tropicimonas sp. TH_r6]MDV7143861.1 hypothetical protein [Tropicimonas sp. TH_r6]
MTKAGTAGNCSDAVAKNTARAALETALASPSFVNAGRLRSFLGYVVEEALAGRGDLISGKTIAQDVYGRDPDETDSIVRVDAGRLRRKLAAYYEAEGAAEPVRIHIDSGGYAPRFEALISATPPAMPPPAHAPVETARGGDLPWILGIAGFCALTLLLWQLRPATPDPTQQEPRSATAAQDSLERTALAEKSPATLQAANLAEKAADLLFPIADAEHQTLATAMYREAIRIDPSHYGGYAGAAHSLATLAMISPDAERSAELLSEAEALAEKAIDLAPLSGWSHSATAWVALSAGDPERAVDLARRAASLSPMDGKVLDFHAVTALMTGHFEEGFDVSAPDRPRDMDGRQPAYLNVHGVANFHLDRFDAAIASFDTAIEQGGPVSELTLLYKAAANQAAGRTEDARALLDELQTTWPAFRPEPVLKRFYRHPEHAERILVELRAAGWPILSK